MPKPLPVDIQNRFRRLFEDGISGREGNRPLWIADTTGFWVVRRTTRLWTDEEMRSICVPTTAPDLSVAQVARRYALNANMIFKCLRDARYAPGSVQGAVDALVFCLSRL